MFGLSWVGAVIALLVLAAIGRLIRRVLRRPVEPHLYVTQKDSQVATEDSGREE